MTNTRKENKHFYMISDGSNSSFSSPFPSLLLMEAIYTLKCHPNHYLKENLRTVISQTFSILI